jgi:hypothetical protein
MAIDLTILQADRQSVIADIPVNVTFGTDIVSCRQSVMAMTDRGAIAGLLDDYVFSIHSVTSEWNAVPAVGDLLTISDVEYRVLQVVQDSVGTRFDMGAKFTGRAR